MDKFEVAPYWNRANGARLQKRQNKYGKAAPWIYHMTVT